MVMQRMTGTLIVHCICLYQMILHHIPQRTCRFIEPASLLDTQIFYGCNFYVVNIVTIPERFEDTVGKTGNEVDDEFLGRLSDDEREQFSRLVHKMMAP